MFPMGAIAEIRPAAHPEVQLFTDDLDREAYGQALRAPLLAWDIETTGLDWRTDRLATVQLQSGELIFLVRVGERVPLRLKRLLERAELPKVMHHAMFDLRFMAHQWQATPRNVACTKIASKLVHKDPTGATHSLAALVRHYFGIELDKGARLSDWTAFELDAAQVRYAADDVRFLQPLYEVLARELEHQDLLDLRDRCYDHLATRVALELGDFGDVYAY